MPHTDTITITLDDALRTDRYGHPVAEREHPSARHALHMFAVYYTAAQRGLACWTLAETAAHIAESERTGRWTQS